MRQPPRLLLASRDAGLAAELDALARGAGAELERVDDLGSAELGSPWAGVLADGRRTEPEALRAALAPDRVVLWLTAEPRANAAERALALGADAVLALPLWAPEARTALDRLLELRALRGAVASQADLVESSEAQVQAYAAQLEASQQNLRELYDELETHARDLQTLISSQQALIPLQGPDEIAGRIQDALERLFPEGRVTVTVSPPVPGEPGGDRIEETAGGAWESAEVPLAAAGLALGRVEVRARPGGSFPRRSLDLLQVYAREAAQALHRSRLYRDLSLGKAEWERTFDTIRDSISVIGQDLVLRRVNRALADDLGREPRELVGRPCHEAIYGRGTPCSACPVQEALRSGAEARAAGEVVRGGRVYDYRAYPLRGDDGQVYAAIAYARDITREEQLSRSLRHSEKLMTLGQIAAGIAHEINNPLTAVSSYAQLLGMRLRDPRDAESALRIQQGVERIHRLVRNLMSFVRPSDESFFPLDLNEVVAETLSFSRYEVTRGDTQLAEELSPGLPRVLGARDQLEHLLVNFLTNARDAVAGRGTIRVATRSDGNRVLLEVADDGVGIQPGDLERIFDPFYTTKPSGKGTGLGLFVAAGIARKHGGELAVWSEPGRGSRFTLELPAFAH